MTRVTPVDRDRAVRRLSAITGTIAAGSLAVTGGLMVLVKHETDTQNARKAQTRQAALALTANLDATLDSGPGPADPSPSVVETPQSPSPTLTTAPTTTTPARTTRKPAARKAAVRTTTAAARTTTAPKTTAAPATPAATAPAATKTAAPKTKTAPPVTSSGS